MNTTYPTALTICESCGSSHEWTWADAFDKFGFGDGDGLVMTSSVADIPRGYLPAEIVSLLDCKVIGEF